MIFWKYSTFMKQETYEEMGNTELWQCHVLTSSNMTLVKEEV